MKRISVLALSTTLAMASFSRAQDADYKGSSFREVVDVLQDKNVPVRSEADRQELEVYRSHKLPQYAMSLSSVFSGGSATLERDAKRTINERFDYYDRIAKLLHPNAVCVTGEWQMDANTPYSGLFSSNSKALFVGRISVAMQNTTSADKRGFGFAGKIFPTMNPDQPVETVNFFTVDVLMGDHTKHFLDTATTNQPALGFSLSLIRLGFKIFKTLTKADDNPGFRPITPIAKVGALQVNSPKWIRLSADSKLVRNDEPDFRDEVVKALEQNGKLIFNIDVSTTTGDRNAAKGWSHIGRLVIDQAEVSYGCDRRLHFAHPRLKD